MKNTYRIKDVEEKLDQYGVYPLDILVTGVTGAGKSSTLNSFFSKQVARVGTGVDAMTMNVNEYRFHKFVRLWDSPGLGDGVNADKAHSKRIIELLKSQYGNGEKSYGLIDMVLVVVEGSGRDMGTTNKLLDELILPNIQADRIQVVINQADLAMKGRYWNDFLKKPSKRLIKFLDDKACSIKRRIQKSFGLNILQPVYYSALHNYNIHKLYDSIVDNMPSDKRPISI